MQQRVNKLREAMAEKGLSAMFVASDINRRYLTGFTGSAGYVLITESGSYLLTDFRYMTQAPQQAKDFKVVEHAPKVMETVKELLGSAGKLGFEQEHVTFATYQSYGEALKGVELVPVSGLVEGLRIFKDEGELSIMREAAVLADRTFSHILTKIRAGVTERELDLQMEMFMRENGATSSSFDTIVASGERSALPHGVASSRALQGNEFITFDFGALLNGYCSDVTRTVVLGEASGKHREVYGIVLEAQLNALDKIRPGMTGREADALTRDIIVSYGYGDNYGHSTGHGLGMEVHESPRLSKLSDDILKPGMVVTVEPGIYIPGFGGVRIEDDIVITETGIEIITSSPKELTLLPMA
ncbi:Xaa-Pro peptidase family protein [Saccharibacillus sp. CPCC 101409]|uniref:M24 family metallopeptidase n=1 Tax=Saccharibacillus sp. CPCC 101409 TaxID=3058041 RepID=UPI002671CDA8|nr:Xaa-Pro peptidase family protein [Saccharibacillus sp. CPCC 101409]MDO3409527.1 Xaa-Pro peptidase family protein [Saccharibacillus sp. CPCC 101409]